MIVPVAMTVIVEFYFSFTNNPNSKYDTVVLVMFNDTGSHVSSDVCGTWSNAHEFGSRELLPNLNDPNGPK